MPEHRHFIDEITFEGVGKRYMFEWVLKEFTYTFIKGNCYGITGPNGSGKSTLMKMLSGFSTPSKGQIEFKSAGSKISIGEVFNSVTFAAPYIELIEEMTVQELMDFHHVLRPFKDYDLTIKALKDLPFKGLVQKRIGELSSGMRQRIKLLLAIMTDTSVILLDEPGSNLDEQGKGWFEDLLKSQMSGRITIIASNEAEDLKLAQSQINIADYK